MDRSCHSSGDSTATTASSSSGGGNHYLKQLSKISHKISKPSHNVISNSHFRKQSPTLDNLRPVQDLPLQHPQNQPPVYNINKNDFRDVVQRLTGSPVHERLSTPPPIHPPKPQSSRLQRIRPPPLAQISNRPPPLLNSSASAAASPSRPLNPTLSTALALTNAGASVVDFPTALRPGQPLSPLPPFPAVHAATESPVSAYLRYRKIAISAIDSDQKRYSGLSPLAPLVSSQWNNLTQPIMPPPPVPLLPHQQPNFFPNPSSPLPFGCFPSPRSPYPLLSPNLLFSPTRQLGFQQFPMSPTLPVSSPRWKGI